MLIEGGKIDMPISILAKYVCERKTDIFADVVNEQFGKTPNDIIRETMEKYSNPSQSVWMLCIYSIYHNSHQPARNLCM